MGYETTKRNAAGKVRELASEPMGDKGHDGGEFGQKYRMVDMVNDFKETTGADPESECLLDA